MRAAYAALLVAGLVGCGDVPPQPPTPAAPISAPLFVVTPRLTPDARAAALAKKLGFTSEPTLTEGAWTIDQDGRLLSVDARGGGISFVDRNNRSAPSGIDEARAIELAPELLAELDLLPIGAEPWRATSHGGGHSWTVDFRFELAAGAGEVPLAGPSVSVELGRHGLIGLTHRAPDLTATETVLLDGGAALIADWTDHFPTIAPAAAPAVFYLLRDDAPGATAAPMFSLTAADATTAPAAVLIEPATADAPRAAIVATNALGITTGNEHHAGAAMFDERPHLEVAIERGAGPFAVHWTARALAADAELLESDGDAVDLELPDGEAEIRVRVTDARGLSAVSELRAFVARGVAPPANGAAWAKPAAAPWQQESYARSGWTLTATQSADDGLVIDKVSFGGHSLARSMSLPYIELRTNLTGAYRHDLLGQDNAQPHVLELVGGGSYHDRYYSNGALVPVARAMGANEAELTAMYATRILETHLGADGQWHDCAAELTVVQRYELSRLQTAGWGAPLSPSAYAYFRPYVTYHFQPVPAPSGASCDVEYRPELVRIYQRFDFDLSDGGDRGAFYKEPTVATDPTLVPWYIPAPAAETATLVVAGATPLAYDNYHQRVGGDRVFVPGCTVHLFGAFVPYWDCLHVHWSWSPALASFDPFFASFGVVTNDQKVNVYLVMAHGGEEDTYPLSALVSPAESLGDVDRDLVLWTVSESDRLTNTVGAADWFFR